MIGCARGRRAALLLIVALVAAVGPVLPVSTQMEARYALSTWLALVIAFIFGCDHLFTTGRTGTVVAILLACIVAITALAVNRQSWARSFAALDRGGQDAYPVPRSAGFQVPGLHAVTLRIHYASPAGWHTYSPELALASGRDAHVTYAQRAL
ncbi:MAG TPA: hypothetical protein VN970_03820, partial [Thermoanaerobaculia bacterium]|nr:hypothetical protein [Thermoanaerobaculia bacterium]